MNIVSKDHPDADILLDLEREREQNARRTGIIVGIAIILIVILAVITGYYYLEQRATAPYKKVCEQNPVQRYAQNCTGYNDCIDKCTARLSKGGT